MSSVKENIRYEPTWDSLDARPLPDWYDDAKIGIFIHWGVFSVPSYGQESAFLWYDWFNGNELVTKFMQKNYPPNFTYQDFAKDFTAEFYDPAKWADLFNASGAKYVVLTSKHHEGFALWPTKYSFSWNAKDVGSNKDLIGELAEAVRNKTDIKFGLYHSLYEWFNPLYLEDKKNNFNTTDFITKKTIPELYELINYYKPEVVWSDGDWEASDSYWTSTEFLAWLYNESPVKETVVTNDRWGSGIMCNHGDFYTCADRFSPGVLQPHKWENCLTIDKISWGFRRNAVLSEFMTPEELLAELVKTVSCGGNFLVNVAPTKEGIITPIYEERLRQIGSWLEINGEAIYGSRPWIYQNDSVTPGVWYTKKGDDLYASLTFWPTGKVLTLGSPILSDSSKVSLLGYDGGALISQNTGSGTEISFPEKSLVRNDWVYVLKITQVSN